jgi:hypothetical protein
MNRWFKLDLFRLYFLFFGPMRCHELSKTSRSAYNCTFLVSPTAKYQIALRAEQQSTDPRREKRVKILPKAT